MRSGKKALWVGVSLWAAGCGLLASVIGWSEFASAAYSHSQAGGRLAFSAYRHGNWDIYTIRADGTDLRRITTDPAEDRAPSWSPDGTQLAFQSNRDGNWEIYVVSLNDLVAHRLTFDVHYDGAPAWSPDGKRIAFESYRNGDLDIFVMNADGSEQSDLTIRCSAADFAPAWSPDGNYLAFTSTRMGDSDLFIMDVRTLEASQWTDSPRPEDSAVWSHDGQFLAFVQDEAERREVYLGKVAESPIKGGQILRLTWSSRDEFPVWSPTGDRIAYISHQHTNQDIEYLLVQPISGLGEGADARRLFARPVMLLAGWEIAGPLSWTANDLPVGETVADFTPVVGQPFSPGLVQVENNLAESGTLPNDRFEDLLDIEAPNARLNARLVESFKRIREEVHQKSGYDFLAELSDMWRGFDADNDEGSAFLTWHKAGRAFDTLFDYRDELNQPLLEVVREDVAGETFWRIFLKAAQQDGTMGMPLKAHPWDLSGKARRKYPSYGGWWKPIPYGYYVDITEIIRHGGWERISAVNRDDFSWKWHFLAIEYWHHQRRDGLLWYQAMETVYPKERLEELYDWRRLIRHGEEPYNLYANGIPIPPSANEWRDFQN